MGFSHEQLNTGVSLYTYETDKFKTITIKLFIQQNLTKETAANSALLSNILCRGSHQYPTTLELMRQMEHLYGASIGSDVMKIGERHLLEFYFSMVDPRLVPHGSKAIAEGLQTFWSLITTPPQEDNGFVKNYFVQEQLNLKRFVDGLINEKRSYAVHRALGHMCAEEPYGIYKYGDQATIMAQTNRSVYTYYQRLLAEYPIDIFVVGPNLRQVVSPLKELVWERQTTKELAGSTTRLVQQPREIKEFRDVNQAILVMGYRTNCTFLDKDYYALVVCNAILGTFPHSKLFVNVRERLSLAYYVGSSLEGSKGIITVTAGIDKRQYEKVVQVIGDQLHALTQGDISQDELSRSIKGLVSGITSMADSPASLIDRNVLGLVHNDLRSSEEVIARLKQVTITEIAAAAKAIQLDTVYFLSGTRGDS